MLVIVLILTAGWGQFVLCGLSGAGGGDDTPTINLIELPEYQ